MGAVVGSQISVAVRTRPIPTSSCTATTVGLYVAAAIAFSGAVVASRRSARSGTPSRPRQPLRHEQLTHRERAVDSRPPSDGQRSSTPRFRCSESAATAARRRPRSRGPQASASRSSIGTSRRSNTSTSPASRRCPAGSEQTAEEIIAGEPDPREWTFAVPRAIDRLRKTGIYPNQLWIQALGQAGEDAELTKYLRGHCDKLHGFAAGIIRRAQEAGGVAADRDTDAEAWIGIGFGLLRSVQARLGGVLTADDFAEIMQSRRLSLLPPAS